MHDIDSLMPAKQSVREGLVEVDGVGNSLDSSGMQYTLQDGDTILGCLANVFDWSPLRDELDVLSMEIQRRRTNATEKTLSSRFSSWPWRLRLGRIHP